MRVLSMVCGLLFGFGVLASGMTDPVKVFGFLDVARPWDPSLMLVMISAVLVAWPFFHLASRRGRDLRGEPIAFPPRHGITRPLLIGSAIFGLGWGLDGLCPGPSIAMLGAGTWQESLFFVSLLFGMSLHGGWQLRQQARAAA